MEDHTAEVRHLFLSVPTHSILTPAPPDWWSWKYFYRWPCQRNSMWWAIEVQDVGPPGGNPLLDNFLVGKARQDQTPESLLLLLWPLHNCCCYPSLRSGIVEVGVGRFPTACKVMNVFISWTHPVLPMDYYDFLPKLYHLIDNNVSLPRALMNKNIYSDTFHSEGL